MKKIRLAIVGLGSLGRKCAEPFLQTKPRLWQVLCNALSLSSGFGEKVPVVTHISELKEVDAGTHLRSSRCRNGSCEKAFCKAAFPWWNAHVFTARPSSYISQKCIGLPYFTKCRLSLVRVVIRAHSHCSAAISRCWPLTGIRKSVCIPDQVCTIHWRRRE